MELDVTLLSRLQFALTVMFHYLFPPLTIGMGAVLVYLEGMYLRTREPVYESAAKFWTSLFALNFAMGVATGIVMEFEFGTNWANYSRFVGDVFGSALAAEGIFAFFLESGFLAVLVFGWGKVSPKFHFFASLMVSLGSVFSAIWIIVANSWQQTPAGHHMVTRTVNGIPTTRAETVDFWNVVFNPSTLNRLTHTLLGAFVLGSFFILSISAWYLLKNKHADFAKRSITGALLVATLSSLAVAVSGDFNARMVADRQPAKLAAMEGLFTTGPADLHVLGLPEENERTVAFSIALPRFLSLLLYRDPDAAVMGLDKVPRQYWPPVRITFLSFHLMVAAGVYMIVLTLLASYLQWKGRLEQHRWLLWLLVVSIAAPFLGNQLGWATAEVGRQPWIVHPNVVRDAQGGFVLDPAGMLQYNLAEGLLTKSAVSPSLRGPEVLTSIVMFGVIYLMLGLTWLYVLNGKIQKGPGAVAAPGQPHGGWLGAAAGRTLHEESLSEAKEEPQSGQA